MSRKRRSAGEGAIYKRKDGRWAASLELGTVNGKRKRKIITGATRKEVADKLATAKRQHEQGVDLTRGRVTVAQFLAQWLESVVKVRNRPRTYYGYAGAIARYLVPHVGAQPLQQLQALHVQQMVAALASTDLAPATVRYARDVLNRALNVAVTWGYIAHNPAAHIAVPRGAGRAITPLSVTQAQQLIASVAGHRQEALYRLALSLGLRRGEVCGLRWVDVDLAGGTLAITGALQRVNNKLERTPTKTEGSAVRLPLPPALVRALEAHQQRQQAERERRGDKWVESGYVFVARYGTPFEPWNLNRQLAGLLKRAGLPSIRVHDLRHSCASLLIAQNVHPKIIQTILRHTNISTTMDVYGHIFPHQHADAAAGLADLLDAPAEAPAEEKPDTEPDAPPADDASGDRG